MGGGEASPRGENPGAFDRVGGEVTTQTSLDSFSQSGSASSNNGSVEEFSSTLTGTELRELDSASDSFSMQPAGSGTSAPDAPTPAEFATQTFASGVQARRIEAGYDGHAVSVPEDTSGAPAIASDGEGQSIAGWHEYEPEADVISEDSLDPVEDVIGHSDEYMYRSTLTDKGTRTASEAYVTDYSEGMKLENAHSQMATYTALDAMGVQAPRHSYDPETQRVTVESLSKPDYDTVNCTQLGDTTTEYVNKIDPEQMKDTMAANALVGNDDLHESNLEVGEDGRVHTFDYDMATKKPSLEAARSIAWNGLQPSIDAVNDARDEPLGFDDQDVYDRAETLATQMENSGMIERVSNAVSKVDDYFRDGDGSLRDNAPDGSYLDIASERIEKHVSDWSAESDDIKM